jgi:hypothetical protein
MTNAWYSIPAGLLTEIAQERARQITKHGDQSHLPDGTGPRVPFAGRLCYMEDAARDARLRCKHASQNEGGDGSITFEHILREEFFEGMAEDDPAKLRAELLQIVAVGVQWIEAIDRRQA